MNGHLRLTIKCENIWVSAQCPPERVFHSNLVDKIICLALWARLCPQPLQYLCDGQRLCTHIITQAPSHQGCAGLCSLPNTSPVISTDCTGGSNWLEYHEYPGLFLPTGTRSLKPGEVPGASLGISMPVDTSELETIAFRPRQKIKSSRDEILSLSCH